MNRGISEESETSEQEYSARRFRFCFDYYFLDNHWKVILKKEVKNKVYKNSQSIFGFSLSRAFQ